MNLGALNTDTGKYISASIAKKDDQSKYKCIDCNKGLIICNQGQIIKPYFRHYSENDPCTFYKRPSETQQHLNAKYKLKNMLENNKIVINKQLLNNLIDNQLYSYLQENTKCKIKRRIKQIVQ